jgi:multicomponent Na+:H+ antiporter subunit G
MSAEILAIFFTGISGMLIATGVFFVLAGAIGIIRLPDFYSRTHAAGMTDTLGAELIILGLMVQAGFSQTSLKLLLVAFFLFITSPTASHAVANAAHQAGLKPLLGKFRSPHPSELPKQKDGH